MEIFNLRLTTTLWYHRLSQACSLLLYILSGIAFFAAVGAIVAGIAFFVKEVVR